jgi:hypothetical protein
MVKGEGKRSGTSFPIRSNDVDFTQAFQMAGERLYPFREKSIIVGQEYEWFHGFHFCLSRRYELFKTLESD